MLAFRLLLFPHHPGGCLARCASFLTLIFVGLFSLISVHVLLTDSQHPVLIASLSSSGRVPRTCPNPLHVLSLVRTGKLHPKWMEFGILGLWLMQLQGFTDSHCSSHMFLFVSHASTCLSDLGQLPYLCDTIQDFRVMGQFFWGRVGQGWKFWGVGWARVG